MIKAIIVDDDESARDELNLMLRAYKSDLDIVNQVVSVKEAVKSIHLYKPHVVFLDVELPGENGFKLFEYFPNPFFSVVFVTAGNDYVIKAIRCSALDYLLKPIKQEELHNALDRISAHMTHCMQVRDLAKDFNKTELSTIVFNTHNQIFKIDIENIVRLEAEGSYSSIFLKDGTRQLITKTLSHFEEILPMKFFFRCHRSHLVNIRYVKGISKQKQWCFIIQHGEIVPISFRKKTLASRVIR